MNVVIASLQLLASRALGIPDPGRGVAPPGAEGLLIILRWAAWTGLAIGVLGVIFAGITMMLQVRRGEGGDGLARLGWTLIGCVLVVGASGLVTAFV